jgi:hypothetical protein
MPLKGSSEKAKALAETETAIQDVRLQNSTLLEKVAAADARAVQAEARSEAGHGRRG